MTVALRRQVQDLANAAPQRSQGDRDQLWRNVATELSHRQSLAAPERAGRLRTFSLLSMVAFALLLVVFLPMMNESQPGGYLLRTPYIEAASRKEQSVILDWRDGNGADRDGYRRIAANPSLELLLYEGGTQFLLRHKSTGQIWSTSPDVRDARVPESLLGRMNSPFAIRYGDDAGRIDEWANPIDHMTMLEYHPLSSGMGLRFIFDTLGIAVRIDYQLGDGYLQVSIPEGGIQETGAYKVKAIEILPFFDTVDDMGAKKLLVASMPEVSDPLSAMFAGVREPSPLLFGISGEKAGFLAEVVHGADVASVHVDPSGYMVDSNRVFVEFQLSGRNDKGTPSSTSARQHTVRYYALTDEKVGQDSVAEVFQRHMKERLGAGRRVDDVRFGPPVAITG